MRGHIQKRVGSRLRKLKLKQKGLGGRGKLTDSFIDKLQNYYGIAIRSNVNNIEKMQSAVIAAFSLLFQQKPTDAWPMSIGPDTWCKFQRATFEGKMHIDTGKGLPQKIIKNYQASLYETM
ncbi:uncharacterized protein TNCV_4052181 [Trichonephila clavipes]|nr:uncharacterized protein TNCV_4052181 [Trichonephila clavipes]